jgi:stearoyl-CoA desaturase (delta-9 desaturase)
VTAHRGVRGQIQPAERTSGLAVSSGQTAPARSPAGGPAPDARRRLQGARAEPAPDVPDDVEPAVSVGRVRVITGIVTVVPILSLFFVGWQLWDSLLGWNDIFVFLLLYVLTGLGVTVGFHRLFTHRAFRTTRSVRAVLAILGSAAIEGPVIAWVADHRKHHAFSDREGDPHSPHVDHGLGLRGAIRGLLHAHVGWLFIHTHRGRRARYAPDLLADPVIRRVDRTFLAWALGGLLAAFALGWLFGGRLRDGLTGLLWGGGVRILVLHHVTYSVNSLCHFFGRRRFETGDESRNLAWLAPLSLGEAWHNNHHAFPTSAEHGLHRWELDPSALVIRILERVGLASDVVRVSPERQAAKLAVLPGP